MNLKTFPRVSLTIGTQFYSECFGYVVNDQ